MIRASLDHFHPYAPPQEGRIGLRLDFNENTSGCAPAVLRALRATTAEDLARYPAHAAAEAGILRAFGHTPATGLLTHGVDDAIALAAMAVLEPGAEAVVVEPTFAMYRFYSEQLGARLRPVRCGTRRRRGRPLEFFTDPTAVRAAANSSTRIVWMASPNNPTGHLTPTEVILRLARALPAVLIFCDEAYGEFAPAGSSLLEAVGGVPNLVVARTFSKAYGLAGARLGCLFAHPGLVARLRPLHPPYAVSTLAARCGQAAVATAGARAWTARYCRHVRVSRARLETTLDALGIPYWKSQANFVLCDAGGRAAAWVAGLRRRGILVRDRQADWPGAVRITAGGGISTRGVCAALRQAWKEAQ